MPRPLSVPLLVRAAHRAASSCIAATLSSAALAQSAAPDPLAASPTAPLTYQSVFEGYRSFRIEDLPPWQSVNDTVRSVGGHTGSVRDNAEKLSPAAPQAQAPEPPAPKAVPSLPVTTEPGSHHGH